MENITIIELGTTFLNIKFFGMPLASWDELLRLIVRCSINLFFITIISWAIYYRRERKSQYLFTFILIGLTIYLLCFLLDNVKLQLGFALGLFAIFGIIRYRTNAIPIKEMTYLFVVIGISVINALANAKISLAEVLFANITLTVIIFCLEHFLLSKQERKKSILYENIELIKPEHKEELIKDLEERTGLSINWIEIKDIDFLRDATTITIYYHEKRRYD